MSPARCPIKIKQGATFLKRFTHITEEYADPEREIDVGERGKILVTNVAVWTVPLEDLSSYYARMYIRDTDDSLIARLLEDNTRLINRRTHGTVIMHMSSLETGKLDFTRGNYDLELVPLAKSESFQAAAGGTCKVEIAQTTAVQDTGTANDPSTASVDTGTGDYAWTDKDYAMSSDDDHATTGEMNAGLLSDFIRVVNFGFDVPPRARITGIEVKIERKMSATGGTIEDFKIYLLKNHIMQIAENKAATGVTWPTTDVVATYGDNADLWSNTWIPCDFNLEGFGVMIQVKNTHGATAAAALIDSITVKIYFDGVGRLTDNASSAAFTNYSADDLIYVETSELTNEGIYKIHNKVSNDVIILTNPMHGSDNNDDETIKISKVTLDETDVWRFVEGSVTLSKQMTYD